MPAKTSCSPTSRPHRLGAIRAGCRGAMDSIRHARCLARSGRRLGRLGPARDTPRLLDPPQGYAWSANARVVGGEAYARIGDGDYAPAARARQIRDRLEAMSHVRRATCSPSSSTIARIMSRQPVRPTLAAAFEDKTEAARRRLERPRSDRRRGFRLLREFERAVTTRAFRMLTVEAQARWPDFSWRTPQRFTEVAWRLVHERPAHLLDPRFEDWDAWLADVANETVRGLSVLHDIAACNWGRVNTPDPASDQRGRAIPRASSTCRGTRFPATGRRHACRPTFGASERFGVSPGREAEGYLHMPGGQSGIRFRLFIAPAMTPGR